MPRRSTRTVRVHEVLYMVEDGPAGVAGDGSHIRRFRGSELAAAKRFAAEHTYYGQPSTVLTDEVPLHLAQRWGVA